MSLSYILCSILAALISVVAVHTPLYQQNLAQMEQDKAWQIAHVAALEQGYADGTIAPVAEADFFDGDLQQALDGGVKLNELRFVATHNSYKNESVPELQMWYGIVNRVAFGLVPENGGEFQAAPLCEQLDNGVRSLEIDVETMVDHGERSFVCLHSPVLDLTTNCYDLALGLRELKLWSDANPGHLPVTLIIEPKVAMLPMPGMDFFTLQNANALDALLRETLGDTLFTPAQMLRDYETFAAMREADDWCRVDALRGKVLVLLHKTLVTNRYIRQDETLRTQAMFPMLRPADAKKPYASFLILNDPKDVLKDSEALLQDGRFILRTRPDSFGSIDEATRTAALDCGAQILSTDYPPLPGTAQAFSLNGKTVALRQ